jgi:thiol-disulfide isomerase/thioredoxin
MKTSYTLALIAVFAVVGGGLFIFLSSGYADAGITVGDQAVNMKFTTIDGSTFDLSGQRGKVVIIDFVTTSCPICVEEFDVLRLLAGDERVKLISVNLDSTAYADLKVFSDYYEVSWAVGSSQQAGLDYKVSAVPTILLIDKDGFIRYRGYYTELDQLQQLISQYA